MFYRPPHMSIPADQSESTAFYLAERKRQRNRLRDLASKFSHLRTVVLPSGFGRMLHQVQPYSMMGYARLKGIHDGVRSVSARSIEGDLVECGTARGGCAALMRLTAKTCRDDRTLWVYDTFEGLPRPTDDNPDYELALTREKTCLGEFDEVEALFKSLEVLDGTHMIKGLFQDTLPETTPDRIALLHLDGDWYESTRVCLDHLYDKVSTGGVIQIDDYGHWAGARKALHEFFDERGIEVNLKYLDYSGRQFVKP
jgi:O-methyltransferase